uniref:Uncharacterized protein n=1 Tax=Cucumis melo TaxID=3656 RepID=A0A9I9E5S6_CUCME
MPIIWHQELLCKTSILSPNFSFSSLPPNSLQLLFVALNPHRPPNLHPPTSHCPPIDIVSLAITPPSRSLNVLSTLSIKIKDVGSAFVLVWNPFKHKLTCNFKELRITIGETLSLELSKSVMVLGGSKILLLAFSITLQ